MTQKQNKKANKRKMKNQKSKKEKNLECPVRDLKGKKVDTVTLNKEVFDGYVNVPLIQQIVTMYNAGQRSGSASTKTKGEVSGGGKKPWKQKGTGRARTGSIRNPLWRGGGIIFGPKPRDFSFSVPKEMKRKALKSSLNDKFINDNLLVIDDLKIDKPKTKLISSVLDSLGVNKGEKTIIIIDKLDDNTKMASRNVPNLTVRAANNFSSMDILKSHKLIIQQSSLKSITKVLQ